jgi:hypothetical protein
VNRPGMANKKLIPLRLPSRSNSRRRRNLFVLFGTSFIIILAVVVNVAFLSKNNRNNLIQQQQQQETTAGGGININDHNDELATTTKKKKKKQQQQQQQQNVILNSISSAKDNFSLKIANENRRQDFMTSYNNPNNAAVTADAAASKKANTNNVIVNNAAGDEITSLIEKSKKVQVNVDDELEVDDDDDSADYPIIIQPTTSSPTEAPVEKIKLLLPQSEIDWIQRRDKEYYIEYMNNPYKKNTKKKRWNEKINFNNSTEVNNIFQEDKDGPWLDFMIAGHPKCGTTTLVANLANIAPMKVKDFCSGEMSTLLGYVYRIWRDKFPEILIGPKKYMMQHQQTMLLSSANSSSSSNSTYNNDIDDNNSNQLIELKGAKCPRFLGDPNIILKFGPRYPKTKIIFGIRHPVLWFTSFFNMVRYITLHYVTLPLYVTFSTSNRLHFV